MVFGSLTIPYHNKKINKIFNKLLSIKYNETLSKESGDNSYNIKDEENNKIIVKNYFYPSLLYVGNNIGMISNLQKTSTEKEAFLTQKHSSEWYHHL